MKEKAASTYVFVDEKLLNIIFTGTEVSELQVKYYFFAEFTMLRLLASISAGEKELIQTRQDSMCCVYICKIMSKGGEQRDKKGSLS